MTVILQGLRLLMGWSGWWNGMIKKTRALKRYWRKWVLGNCLKTWSRGIILNFKCWILNGNAGCRDCKIISRKAGKKAKTRRFPSHTCHRPGQMGQKTALSCWRRKHLYRLPAILPMRTIFYDHPINRPRLLPGEWRKSVDHSSHVQLAFCKKWMVDFIENEAKIAEKSVKTRQIRSKRPK